MNSTPPGPQGERHAGDPGVPAEGARDGGASGSETPDPTGSREADGAAGWQPLGLVVGVVAIAIVLVVALMWALRPGPSGMAPATTGSADSSLDVTPVDPGEPSPTGGAPTGGPGAAGPPVSSSLSGDATEPALPSPLVPATPGEPAPADWVEEDRIRVITHGSSSCPARLVETVVLEPDQLLVRFDSRYDRPCTMDYVPTEHVVEVPAEATGRPLVVRIEILGQSGEPVR
ncbi:hypothetical protein [Zhihengliuella sp.]|uniref:hypothetical protein n=1 Tax=Zhihengliuella sp. TaxID=1954483 RepID=UPI0028117CB5|nr:hypothetical protein [Zhihengliuella sp.]